MNPEERANKTIWWVVEHLQEQIILQKYTNKLIVITVDIEELSSKDPNSPSISDIRNVIVKMYKKWEILEIVERTGRNKDKYEYNWNKNVYFVLEINPKKFDRFYSRYKEKMDRSIINKNKKALFLENESIIKVGGVKCHIPPNKNEFDLCQIMFKKGVGTSVEWDVVYEKITGNQGSKNNSRSIYDTVMRLNKRFMLTFKTKENLFTWENKTIKRNL